MRFDTTPPFVGAKRLKTGFLLFPKTIRCQMRWLEVTSWIQIYGQYTRSYKGIPVTEKGWRDYAWTDQL